MPTVLSDPSPTFYIILGVVVIVLAAIWVRTPKRGNLVQFAAGVGVLLLVFVVDTLVESPREEAVRRMKEMARATRERQAETFARHVSESFASGGVTKTGLRDLLSALEHGTVSQVGGFTWKGGEVWSFDRADYQQVDDATLKIGFVGQASGLPQTLQFCVATFRKEGAEWHMIGIVFHDPIQRTGAPAKTLSELVPFSPPPSPPEPEKRPLP